MDTLRYRVGRPRRIALAVLVPVAFVTLSTGPSGAAPQGPPNNGDAHRPVDPGENETALRHWTEERMKNAQPASLRVVGQGNSPAEPPDRGRPFDVPPAPPTPPAAGKDKAGPDAGPAPEAPSTSGTTAQESSTTEGYWQGSNTANPNRQIGRLFYQKWSGGAWRDGWCSASVVNSENKSVVWTAGHCVYETYSNVWNRNYVFCPGYRNGSCPLGRWTPYSQRTTSQWQSAVCTADGRCNTNEFNYDLGALKMNTLNGYRIANYLGSHGVRFNSATYQYRYLFGYPGNKSSGQYLYYCAGNNTYIYGNLRLAPCSAGGGASGGPWLSQVASSWLGYVDSVNSHGDGTYMAGPYQGAVAQSLYGGVRY